MPAKNENPDNHKPPKKKKIIIDYDDLSTLSKEELIDEIIKARIEAERAKKGYTVSAIIKVDNFFKFIIAKKQTISIQFFKNVPVSLNC